MSRGPWLKKRPQNQKMILEARVWANEHYLTANKRTLDNIESELAYQNLLRDVTNLNAIESKYNGLTAAASEAPKIKCPICNSKEFLVEGFAHKKVLVCERPTCTYIRAVQNRDKLTRTSHLQIVK